jgi:hypothetical protein
MSNREKAQFMTVSGSQLTCLVHCLLSQHLLEHDSLAVVQPWAGAAGSRWARSLPVIKLGRALGCHPSASGFLDECLVWIVLRDLA